MTHPSRALPGPRPRHRLLLGGACRDCVLLVAGLKAGAKHPVLFRGRYPGGGGVNAARAHRRLAPPAQPIVLLAATGDDRAGRSLRRRMAAGGIAMPWPPIPGTATSASHIILDQGSGAATVLSEPGARAAPLPPDLLEEALDGAAFCCLASHARTEEIPLVLTAAARHHVPVFLGLAGKQVQLGYDGLRAAFVAEVELVACNRDEAAQLTGRGDVADHLEALRFGGAARAVMVTDGANGIHAWRDGKRYHVPAYADRRRVVSDLGAGDAALAAAIDALVRGHPPEAALRAAARQGFEACLRFGSSTSLIGEVEMREYLSLAAEAA